MCLFYCWPSGHTYAALLQNEPTPCPTSPRFSPPLRTTAVERIKEGVTRVKGAFFSTTLYIDMSCTCSVPTRNRNSL